MQKKDNEFLVSHLVKVSSSDELKQFINSLEPHDKQYFVFKEELRKQYDLHQAGSAAQLSTALNFYRWGHHFNFDKFIVVNIGSATLRYYEKDAQVLFSKMVVGKPSTKTPRFAATCPQVILIILIGMCLVV